MDFVGGFFEEQRDLPVTGLGEVTRDDRGPLT